jgi:hypothetical protein
MINIGIVIAVFWALVYSLPSPQYDIKTTIKEVLKPYPVVRTFRYVAQKQVLTKTVRYTEDSRFNFCIHQKTTPYSKDEMNECMNFAKAYMQPRTVIQQVRIPIYSGVQIKTVMWTRDARVRWCAENVSGMSLEDCTSWAKTMEGPAQIQVKIQHDPYLTLFKECNNIGTIVDNDGGTGQGAIVRNDRLKICEDVALRGSRP